MVVFAGLLSRQVGSLFLYECVPCIGIYKMIPILRMYLIAFLLIGILALVEAQRSETDSPCEPNCAKGLLCANGTCLSPPLHFCRIRNPGSCQGDNASMCSLDGKRTKCRKILNSDNLCNQQCACRRGFCNSNDDCGRNEECAGGKKKAQFGPHREHVCEGQCRQKKVPTEDEVSTTSTSIPHFVSFKVSTNVPKKIKSVWVGHSKQLEVSISTTATVTTLAPNNATTEMPQVSTPVADTSTGTADGPTPLPVDSVSATDITTSSTTISTETTTSATHPSTTPIPDTTTSAAESDGKITTTTTTATATTTTTSAKAATKPSQAATTSTTTKRRRVRRRRNRRRTILTTTPPQTTGSNSNSLPGDGKQLGSIKSETVTLPAKQGSPKNEDVTEFDVNVGISAARTSGKRHRKRKKARSKQKSGKRKRSHGRKRSKRRRSSSKQKRRYRRYIARDQRPKRK